MKFPISLLLLSGLFVQSVSADTVVKVEKARWAGPYSLQAPVMMDSVNKAQKKFSFDSYLSETKPNWNALFGDEQGKQILAGDTIARVQNNASLNFFTFNLNCNRFVKGELRVLGLKNNKVFVDGNAASGELSLEPGLHKITIASLSTENRTDSFNVEFNAKVGLPTIQMGGRRAYTLNDITDGLRYVGSSVSPTGKYALVNYSNTEADGSSTRKTQLVEVATNKVVNPQMADYRYRWMEKEDVLYYMRKEGDHNVLATLSIPQNEEKIVARNIPNLRGAEVSPNLKYVVFYTDDNKNRNSDFMLYNMPDDRLSDSKNHSFLNVYDLTTGISRPITYGQTSAYLSDISDDGRYLMFISSKMELHRFPFSRSSVYTYDLEQNRVDTIFTDTVGIKQCSFSPDAKQILLLTDAEAFGGLGKQVPDSVITNVYDTQMFLYTIASGKVCALTKDFDPSVNNAVWSEHDGMVYFTATNGGRNTLHRLNPETGKIETYELPIASVQQFSLSNCSNVITYYGNGATYARKMFWTQTNNLKGKSKKLGCIYFEEMYADVDFPTFAHWNYKSSRGDSIHGFYYLPPSFDKNKKYPLIVYYYGGCVPTMEQLETNYPFAVWAEQGYVVYVVQPSGATGFGQEFAARHVNTWGLGSSDDILEGTKEFCATHPFVNKDRMACIGASYGGFMTEYLMTRTDMFRTSVAHAGISDITGYWGAGNWGYTYSEVAAAKSFPWNNTELYVNQSPLYHADRIKTPMLLIQGSVDSNVPANQAWQLYTALKILNKEVAFLQVKGEDHVIRDYKKQKEWQKAICAWFARWLKDEPEWWSTLYPSK